MTGREHVSDGGTGDSNAVYPTEVGRAHASGRTGGRRQHMSPMPDGNLQNRVQDCQGRPVNMDAHGGREESRGWPFEAGAPLRQD